MKKLEILKGNDMTTRDIVQMNDYFDSYIGELMTDLQDESVDIDIPLSAADIGILSEIANLGSNFGMAGTTQYVLDMNSLPQDIKDGLKSGRYKFGDSKQVAGNLRPTIVDTMNNNTRVKDVTVKEVKNTPKNSQVISNLMLQIQMKQMAEQINELCDMTRYMIKRHRDRDLKEPFFKARNSIVSAQAASDDSEQKTYLLEAMKNLENVIQAGYQSLETDAQFLEEETRSPLRKYKDKKIRMYMGYICEDIYMINKSLGLNMLVYKHLERMDVAKIRLMEYVEAMYSFSQKPIGSSKRTAVGVLQDNFPYSKKNYNMWMTFSVNILKVHDEIEKIGSVSHTYLISAEAVSDETL